jgi:hypothetical protein
VHQAAELQVEEGGWVPYRVAWVGACVLYRRDALLATGGFDFWVDLPTEHSGEDVAAQWRIMERFGGAGIVPSGAVHLEAPTTLPVREVDAHDVLWGTAPKHRRSEPQTQLQEQQAQQQEQQARRETQAD